MAACTAPRLFRHRRTHQYWVAACTRWVCARCIRKVAWQWRQILNWAAQHGPASQYLITLTLCEELPLWRQAPADQQLALKEQAGKVSRLLTRALSRLVEEIRAQHGPFEYLAVIELTTGRRTPGHRPHLHLLARGPRLSTRWLSQRCQFHTKGSFKVDIQKLKSLRQAGDYLIGYTVAARKQAQRLARLQQVDEEARSVLIERNLRLVAHIVNTRWAESQVHHRNDLCRGHVAPAQL